jgi:hypothetical protein
VDENTIVNEKHFRVARGHTMAFSNAVRVMMSRGHMFRSSNTRIVSPIVVHSSSFSCDSAGKDDEPGRVIPSASAALAIVFAVYICHRHA